MGNRTESRPGSLEVLLYAIEEFGLCQGMIEFPDETSQRPESWMNDAWHSSITHNGGSLHGCMEPWFSDLRLVCDDACGAGDHAVYSWTFTGTHAATGNALSVSGWEERDLDSELKVIASRGWYDVADYERQTKASDA